MFDVLLKSFAFVLIVAVGYSLKQVKILKKEDANVDATIIMNITLFCVLLAGANALD